jgi:hypothetical protein
VVPGSSARHAVRRRGAARRGTGGGVRPRQLAVRRSVRAGGVKAQHGTRR